MTIAIGNIPANSDIDSGPLNSIFTSYGNEINRIGPIVDAATSGGSYNTLVLRPPAAGNVLTLDTVTLHTLTLDGTGTFGSVVSGTVSATPTATTSSNFYAALMTAQTGPPFLLQNAAKTANLWYVDVTGAVWSAATMTAVNGFVGNASTATQLAGFAPSVTGTNNSVTFAAGQYVNSNGTQIDVAQTTINFASFNAVNYVPTTGNQWIAVSLDNNGNYALTPGTVNGAKTTAIAPANTYGLVWVLLRQNNTEILLADDSTAGHGYVSPRPVGSAFGSGGSSATTLAPLYQTYLQPDLKSRLIIASGNATVTLQAGSSATGNFPATPCLIAVQGKGYQFTANSTTTNTAQAALGGSGSGQVLLVADVNAGTIFFVAANATLTTYQVVLQRYYWAAGSPGALVIFHDNSPMQSIESHQVIPDLNVISVSNSSATNHTGWAPGTTPIADTNMALNAFNLAVPMTVHITGFAHIKTHLTATGDAVNMIVQANGGYASAPWVEAVSGGVTYPYIHEQVVPIEAWIDLPSPGYWQVGQYWSTTGGATVDLFDRALTIEFYALRQTI